MAPLADRRRRSLDRLAVVGVAGLAVLAAGCGSSKPAVAALGVGRTTTTASEASPVAYAHCMRSHGVPNFPDPDPQGGFPSFDLTVSKQAAHAADAACRRLLPTGGPGTPQQRQQKLAFALKVARCLRTHGYPTFPDPGTSGTQIPPGIDTNSPRFQTVEMRCEQQARKALGLP